jgi:DNA-binding NtrC family response regulator
MMKGRVCLIVDDEPAVREYLKAVLQGKSFEMLEASNAVQALQIVHKVGGIDLVISDIQMPGDIDGLDLARSLKNSHPALPVILISGFANKVTEERFIFIQKPFLPKTILEKIDGLLISAPKIERDNWRGRHAS